MTTALTSARGSSAFILNLETASSFKLLLKMIAKSCSKSVVDQGVCGKNGTIIKRKMGILLCHLAHASASRLRNLYPFIREEFIYVALLMMQPDGSECCAAQSVIEDVAYDILSGGLPLPKKGSATDLPPDFLMEKIGHCVATIDEEIRNKCDLIRASHGENLGENRAEDECQSDPSPKKGGLQKEDDRVGDDGENEGAASQSDSESSIFRDGNLGRDVKEPSEKEETKETNTNKKRKFESLNMVEETSTTINQTGDNVVPVIPFAAQLLLPYFSPFVFPNNITPNLAQGFAPNVTQNIAPTAAPNITPNNAQIRTILNNVTVVGPAGTAPAAATDVSVDSIHPHPVNRSASNNDPSSETNEENSSSAENVAKAPVDSKPQTPRKAKSNRSRPTRAIDHLPSIPPLPPPLPNTNVSPDEMREWESGFSKLEEHYEEHGTYDNLSDDLKEWSQEQQDLYSKGKLSLEQWQRLTEIDFDFSLSSASIQTILREKAWEEKYQLLMKHYEEFGHFKKLPGNLGPWLKRQRNSYRDNKLSEEKVQKLKEINFGLRKKPHQNEDSLWDEKYNELLAHYKEHGHLKDISTHLRGWSRVQQNRWNRNRLTEEQEKKLQDINLFDSLKPSENFWDENYSEFLSLQDQKLEIPKRLKSWLWRQRNANNSLSETQIEKLKLLGVEAGNLWDEKYNELLSHYKEHGHLNDISTHLRGWSRIQQKRSKKSMLSEEQEKKLQQIKLFDYLKPSENVWDKNYSEFLSLQEQNLKIPKRLKSWLWRQRNANNSLSETQIEKLKLLGAEVVGESSSSDWEKNFSKLEAHYKENGIHSNISPDMTHWCWRQSCLHDKNALPQDRIDRLTSINFEFNPSREHLWQEMYNHLVDHYQREGSHLGLSKRLGLWVSRQQSRYKQKKISDDEVEKLREIDFDFDELEENTDIDCWDDMYRNLAAKWNEADSEKDLPASLKKWVRVQRSRYTQKLLSENEIKKLEELRAFSFKPRPVRSANMTFQWNKNYNAVVQYLNEHGSLEGLDYPLKKWLQRQRARSKERTNTMTEEEITKLEAINFGVPEKTQQPRKQNYLSKLRVLKVQSETDDQATLLTCVIEKYFEEKQHYDTLPVGFVGSLIEEVRQDLMLNHVVLDKKEVYEKIRTDRRHLKDPIIDDEYEGDEDKAKKALFDEVLERYTRAKEGCGDKMPRGMLASIIKETKEQMGLESLPGPNMKKIRWKHSKNVGHPTMEFTHLSDDDKRRRQILCNEITLRYAARKESHLKEFGTNLPGGVMDEIVEAAKNDLGIHDIEINKKTLQARVFRKSLTVFTMGKASVYNKIDEPLIEALNDRLSQGSSVTREEALELANSLYSQMRIEEGTTDEEEIVLDARWWAVFIDRNKHRLPYAMGSWE